jgi:hypothetical protein
MAAHWRVVWPDGSPATDFWGFGWGSGDPVDGFTPGPYDPDTPNEGVEIGTVLEIKNVANNDSWANIHVSNTRAIGNN